LQTIALFGFQYLGGLRMLGRQIADWREAIIFIIARGLERNVAPAHAGFHFDDVFAFDVQRFC
jgi:hypothetical protein